MAPIRKPLHPKRSGAVLIVSMIFVLIFSALAVSMATLSGTNVQLASNQHKIGSALASAESGVEVTRYWLSRVTIAASVSPSNYFSTIVGSVQSDLAANSISNVTLNADGSISPVTLDAVSGQSFNAQVAIQPGQPDILEVYATGGSGQITRTIKVCYEIAPRPYPIFDYGLATKGPLYLNGNPTLVGVNDGHEADIYIESENDGLALRINGNTEISGDISIGNPDASVSLTGNNSIGGETGQAAIDNHIFIGAGTAEFPVPDTAHFLQYATGDIIDSSTNTHGNMILTNATVLAGTNPTFNGNVEIMGILFIESPNRVRFSGNAEITGLIVADGNVDNPSSQNTLTFSGNVDTSGISDLPDEPQFDQLRQETGSLILAPGFSASFRGNFGVMNGTIAVSGAEFLGNIHGVIKGSIINYSDGPMSVRGNVNFQFDRSDTVETPAGFDSIRVLTYNPSYYEEILP